MHILPAYKQHVQARGGASLLRYLSCHSMRLRWPWAGKVYFVVMRNFFPAKPQLSFDLKGATANRRALKAWQLHQTNTVSNIYNTLRDWEWMDIGMATDLEPADRDELWSIISADTALLRRLSLLDYSLLLGIYRPPPTMLPQQKCEPRRRRHPHPQPPPLPVPLRRCRPHAEPRRPAPAGTRSSRSSFARAAAPPSSRATGRRSTSSASSTCSSTSPCAGGCSASCSARCTASRCGAAAVGPQAFLLPLTQPRAPQACRLGRHLGDAAAALRGPLPDFRRE